MSREEVSALGSARREEVRRQIENSERLKANPLLYLVSPQVKVILFSLFYYFRFNFIFMRMLRHLGHLLNLFIFVIDNEYVSVELIKMIYG